MRTNGDYVVSGGYVLSMDDVLGDFEVGDVWVRDGKIQAVANTIDAPGVERLEAKGMIVLPGFVDTHWHLWNSYLRGLVQHDMPGSDYWSVTVALGAHTLPTDTRASTLLSAAQAISSGITTVHDWSHNVRGREWAEASIQALKEAGLRARYSWGWAQRGDLSKTIDFAAYDTVRQAVPSESNMLQFGFASRNLVPGQSARGSISLDVAQQDWAAARERGLPITLHASPRGLVSMLERESLLRSDLLLVHPMLTTPDEERAVAEGGAAWSMSTLEEAERGPEEGIRFSEIEQAGGLTGLSIDSSAVARVDFFAVMRALRTATAHRFGADQAPTSRRLVRLATLDGARCLGLDRVVGSLTPGKRADIQLVRADGLSLAPVGDPYTALVAHASPADVDTVIVDGEFLRLGGVTEVLDEAAVVEDAIQAAWTTARRAKYAK